MSQALGHQLEQNINSMTEAGKLAVVLCAQAFRFGGNWGFMRTGDANFKETLETLKDEQPNVKFYRLANGALITCKEQFLAYNVNIAVPNAIGVPFAEKAKERKKQEIEKFRRLLTSAMAGKSTHVEKRGRFNELTIGIYCTNEVNTIRLNGKDYPAYKLDLIEALQVAHEWNAKNRVVMASAVDASGDRIFDQIQNLAANSKGLSAIYRGLELSDTGTGVFLKLRFI